MDFAAGVGYGAGASTGLSYTRIIPLSDAGDPAYNPCLCECHPVAGAAASGALIVKGFVDIGSAFGDPAQQAAANVVSNNIPTSPIDAAGKGLSALTGNSAYEDSATVLDATKSFPNAVKGALSDNAADFAKAITETATDAAELASDVNRQGGCK